MGSYNVKWQSAKIEEEFLLSFKVVLVQEKQSQQMIVLNNFAEE
jgi:hypothetical protein